MIEVIKDDKGKYRWRVLDEAGRVVPIRPGRVVLPAGSREANRRSRAAVQKVLKAQFEAQQSRA